VGFGGSVKDQRRVGAGECMFSSGRPLSGHSFTKPPNPFAHRLKFQGEISELFWYAVRGLIGSQKRKNETAYE